MPDDGEQEAYAEVDLDEAAASSDPPPGADAPAPGDPGAGDSGPVDPDDIDLPTALAQRDEYLALARRVQADFENFRKRTIKQGQDGAAYATGRLVESLLPVLDACDAAIIHGVDGVAPIHKTLFDALAKAGLELIDTDGAPFDPNQHEAVLHEPGDGGEPVVVEALRTGYRWQGKVLRAAMVKVKD
ncbi:MAG: nucleotide exchange factor GrpE [Acidimicrobiia bacterium]|nr:nucleotide exchange factor GrpE [Acidimicrobiia bacterium]